VIIRILGQGQYDVPDDTLAELNVLDDALIEAVDSGDADKFSVALGELLERVQAVASPHAPDALDTSDLILPGPDSSLEEVQELLGSEGLIPD
jgi:hypothetical protein